MNDVNPLDMIRNRALAEQRERERNEEIFRNETIKEFITAIQDVPANIAAREYMDCNIVTWNGKEFAGFSMSFMDSDARMLGAPLLYLFNDRGEALPIFNVQERRLYQIYEGGAPLSAEGVKSSFVTADRLDQAMALAEMLRQSVVSDEVPMKRSRVHGIYEIYNGSEVARQLSFKRTQRLRS